MNEKTALYGWGEKILRIDLTSANISTEALDPEVAKKYIGGRGLGIHYLAGEVDPNCDPLAPENKVIMTVGPLTGTAAPTGARYMVTKVPFNRSDHVFELRWPFSCGAEKNRARSHYL